jgi:hypothetical protein
MRIKVTNFKEWLKETREKIRKETIEKMRRGFVLPKT